MKKAKCFGFVAIACALGILTWLLSHSFHIRVPGSEVEKRVSEILRDDFSIPPQSVWKPVNASGGQIGSSVLSMRSWREYYEQAEGSVDAFESLSNTLAGRHSSIGFCFSPDEDRSERIIMNHPNSLKFAPWWHPETNTEPMLRASIGSGARTVYMYGFKKEARAVLYLHVIIN